MIRINHKNKQTFGKGLTDVLQYAMMNYTISGEI